MKKLMMMFIIAGGLFIILAGALAVDTVHAQSMEAEVVATLPNERVQVASCEEAYIAAQEKMLAARQSNETTLNGVALELSPATILVTSRGAAVGKNLAVVSVSIESQNDEIEPMGVYMCAKLPIADFIT